MSNIKFLPDYAEKTKENNLKLHKVGNSNIFVYRTDYNDEQVLTNQSIYVSLLNFNNGIHMSRLIQIAHDYQGNAITPDNNILYDIADSHEADNGFWECEWSSMHSIDDFQTIKVDCKLEGIFVNEVTKWFMTLKVPYTSVCPCSAEMTKECGGIPHMQRATTSITGSIDADDDILSLFPQLTVDILNAVKVYPIPLMKREDELSWCQNASRYNYFVEDASRLCGEVANKHFSDWVVVNTHEESIHQHNVVAICRKGDQLL